MVAALLCAAGIGPRNAEASDFDLADGEVVEAPEFELTVEYREDTPNRSALLPEFELTYPLRPGMQLKLETEWTRAELAHRAGATGFGDVQVEVTWLIAPGRTPKGLSLQWRPEIRLPPGNASLGRGSDHVRVALPVVIAWTSGPLTLAAEAGYEREGPASRVPARVAVFLEPVDTLEFGLEIAEDLECEAAVEWRLGDHLKLEVELEHALRASNNEPPTALRVVLESRF